MPASDAEPERREDASHSADALATLVCVYEWSIEGRRRIVGAGGQPVRNERLAHVPIYVVQGELRLDRSRVAAALGSLARAGLVRISTMPEKTSGSWLLPSGGVLRAGWAVPGRRKLASAPSGSLVSPELLNKMFPYPEVPFVRVEDEMVVEGQDGDRRFVELTSAGIDLAHTKFCAACRPLRPPTELVKAQREVCRVDERSNLGLKPSRVKAYRLFKWALEQNPALATKTDREAYDWIALRGDAPEDLPGRFASWTKYLREARAAHDDHKHAPRTARKGRSIIGPGDL